MTLDDIKKFGTLGQSLAHKEPLLRSPGRPTGALHRFGALLNIAVCQALRSAAG